MPDEVRRVVRRTVASKDWGDELISFAEEQFAKFKGYTDLGQDVGWFALNEALMGYSSMYSGLCGLELIAKVDLQTAKNELQEFMSEKFMEARNILNPTELSASKWASQKEIEMYVHTHWKEEYVKLRNAVQEKELKLDVVSRLINGLSDYKFNVSRLCRNQEVECGYMMSNSIQNMEM